MQALEAFDTFLVSVSRESWATFRRDPLLFVLAAVLMTLLSILSLGLLAAPLLLGYIELIRSSRRAEPLALSLLFSRFDSFVASLVAVVLIAIAVTIGLTLLLLPGLLIALFASYTLHVIAYERSSGVLAIQRSFALVRAYFLHTLAVVLLVSVAQTLGGLVVFGVLLTLPLSLIALTVSYERLTGLSAAPVRG